MSINMRERDYECDLTHIEYSLDYIRHVNP